MFSDSQIIVNQFNERYRITQEHFKKYFNESKSYVKHIQPIKIQWVPREQNKEADKLSKMGLSLVKEGILGKI